MGCSKNYIMYWGLRLLVYAYPPPQVCINMHCFVIIFCAFLRGIIKNSRNILEYREYFGYNSHHTGSGTIFKQCLEFLAGDPLFFDQQFCRTVQHIHMILQDLSGLLVAVLDNVTHFSINILGHRFTV